MIPYGVNELDPQPHLISEQPRRVRCYVKDCPAVLCAPTKHFSGDVCPTHGIRCHYSSAGATYSYLDAQRNFIVDADLAATRVMGNPLKYESHRLGLEKSEDALTWNVFRSFQKAGCLHSIAEHITGKKVGQEPQLFLWGLNISDDSFGLWDLLNLARVRFESRLPVKRPHTEPDIVLLLPGSYLIFIEAKFTSPNPYYVDGPRRDATSLTKTELVEIYWEQGLKTCDPLLAKQAKQIPYQLWRNMIFSEYLSVQLRDTEPFLVNLVREAANNQTAFHNLMFPEYRHRFVVQEWTSLPEIQTNEKLLDLRAYLDNKTAGLQPAFAVGPNYSGRP